VARRGRHLGFGSEGHDLRGTPSQEKGVEGIEGKREREGERSLPYTTGLSSLPAGETNVVFGLTVRGANSAMAERL
jgi:hypothetical protein